MFDANPYIEKSPLEEHKTENLSDLIKDLRNQLRIVNEDMDSWLLFVSRLETQYFEPNEWCWDTQDEIAAYRRSMRDIRMQLPVIEADLDSIENWDFGNLEKLREQKSR